MRSLGGFCAGTAVASPRLAASSTTRDLMLGRMEGPDPVVGCMPTALRGHGGKAPERSPTEGRPVGRMPTQGRGHGARRGDRQLLAGGGYATFHFSSPTSRPGLAAPNDTFQVG